MTTRPIAIALVLAAGIGMAACGQKADAPSSARKADESPVAGAQPAYTSPGWKAGDATSWDQHMRARTQQQNEYNRMEAARQ